jgi:hypothetical protein
MKQKRKTRGYHQPNLTVSIEARATAQAWWQMLEEKRLLAQLRGITPTYPDHSDLLR